ncbi:hypothetical protein GXM_03246 [Nostoc sphaeroides CCNUC1]|uniref:Uncharacterized protein n=1 Tax=Nostoc sphaeroides CCNUC1 TaxID=2653204 RepID=A0A5P8W172_9NOSO|nr:hypothetical protein GXM_03246 [Nostoc sphaeroides CCNUC1]
MYYPVDESGWLKIKTRPIAFSEEVRVKNDRSISLINYNVIKIYSQKHKINID